MIVSMTEAHARVNQTSFSTFPSDVNWCKQPRLSWTKIFILEAFIYNGTNNLKKKIVYIKMVDFLNKMLKTEKVHWSNSTLLQFSTPFALYTYIFIEKVYFSVWAFDNYDNLNSFFVKAIKTLTYLILLALYNRNIVHQIGKICWKVPIITCSPSYIVPFSEWQLLNLNGNNRHCLLDKY